MFCYVGSRNSVFGMQGVAGWNPIMDLGRGII